MDDFTERLIEASELVKRTPDRRVRADLTIMLESVNKSTVTMDLEAINCRRLKKHTLRYIELEKRRDELLRNLEKHLTFSRLLD